MGEAKTAILPKARAPRVRTPSRSPAARGTLSRAPVAGETAPAAPILQTALKVGADDDPLEREAEATAARIVAMPAPEPGTAPPAPPSGAAARRAAVDQESQPDTATFDASPPIPADHQDPEIPPAEDVDASGLTDDEFGEIETGEPAPPDLSLSPAGPAPAVVGPAGGDAPADVARAVAQPGSGRPMPAPLRAFMEPRFGVGFADVRLHDAPADRRAADRIGARAFAHRNHIWIGEGERAEDRGLLAHELTHVVQQTRRAPLAQRDARRDAPTLRRGWIADKAERVARNVPGYTLLTVILGRSPITGDDVPRTAENLVGGFLGLLPGGEQIFRKLQETRALERAFDWISGRLAELDVTWSRIKRLVSDFLDEMPDTSPLAVAKRIFKPLVADILTFVAEIKDKILEFILRGALSLAGPWGEKVWAIVEQARETLTLILNDPIGFARNLIGAVVKGFRQFGSKIWTHLKKGLMGWLFGTLQGMEIQLPEKLDFKGIVSVALQILGLTYAGFRKTLVAKLGRGGEKKVSFLEKSVEVVRTLLAEGFVGIWQRVLEMIDGFKTTVIDGIRDFVINTLVMGAVSWIAGLSNPVGAIVKIALSIYNMIRTFLERLDQIIELAQSIFSSVGAIARGRIDQAADFIETTIARTIPVFLAFVAALIPVTGITKAIRTIIKKLQAPVKKAMEKMIGFLVKKAKKLFSKILGKLNRKRALPQAGFVVGKAPHALVPGRKGAGFALEIASAKPRPAGVVQAEMKAEAKKAAEFGDDSKCVDAFELAFKVEVDEAEASLAKVKPDQRKTSTKKPGDKAAADTADAGAKLAALGPCIADNPFLDDGPPDGAIIRAREPRIPEIEGDADLHSARGAVTSQAISSTADKAGLGPRGAQRLSNYYENDHVPEKSLAFLVQTYVQGKLKEEIAEGRRDGAPLPEPLLGDIDARAVGKEGEHLPAITLYRPAHRRKTAADAGRRNHARIISDAQQEASPLDKIARLRAGVSAEMQAELEGIAGLYNADPAATKAIRGKLRAGVRRLGDLNKTLYGFEPGKAPVVKRAPENAAEGSDLPMEGDAAAGLPDFADLEGALAIYKAKPEGVGNYLEYDHLIEATLAEKARALDLSAPAFSGGLEDAVMAGAEARAGAGPAAEEGAAKEGGGKPKDADRIAAEGLGRLRALKGPVHQGAAVLGYDRDAAGTVALYRPVHREITARRSAARGDLLEGVNLTEARRKLVDYALSDPVDESLMRGAVADLRAGVARRFDAETQAHAGDIKDAYRIELKEFMALNRSKAAGAKMAAVIERVGGALSQLRNASLALVK